LVKPLIILSLFCQNNVLHQNMNQFVLIFEVTICRIISLSHLEDTRLTTMDSIMPDPNSLISCNNPETFVTTWLSSLPFCLGSFSRRENGMILNREGLKSLGRKTTGLNTTAIESHVNSLKKNIASSVYLSSNSFINLYTG